MNILLMEDDAVLSDILLEFLRESWTVAHAYNAKEVLSLLESQKFELFIFDINVAGQDGLALLKELRSYNNTTPTIFITAYTDTQHLKRAFDLGAHDYIKKPFALEELNVRIENTRRLFHLDTDTPLTISENISFFPKLKEITKEGKKYSIGSKNSQILHYFLNNKQRLLSNEELIQNIWDYDSIPSDATLRSHIRTLRDIIGKERITTVRGSGYIYE